MPSNFIAPQKQMTGMFGHPVAENPIDQMFDAVYKHYGLNWQFWKMDINSALEIPTAIAGAKAMGFAGFFMLYYNALLPRFIFDIASKIVNSDFIGEPL